MLKVTLGPPRPQARFISTAFAVVLGVGVPDRHPGVHRHDHQDLRPPLRRRQQGHRRRRPVERVGSPTSATTIAHPRDAAPPVARSTVWTRPRRTAATDRSSARTARRWATPTAAHRRSGQLDRRGPAQPVPRRRRASADRRRRDRDRQEVGLRRPLQVGDRSSCSPARGAPSRSLVGIAKFGTPTARRRLVRADRHAHRAAARGRAGQVRLDLRRRGARRLAGRARAAARASGLPTAPRDHRRAITKENQDIIQQAFAPSTPSCSRSRSSRVRRRVHHLQHVLDHRGPAHPERALLRALGAGRRQVLGSVVLEAIIVGIVASILGILLGIVLAVGLRALLGAGAIGQPLTLVAASPVSLISFIIGVVVTVVSAFFPAWKAPRGRRSPPGATSPSTPAVRSVVRLISAVMRAPSRRLLGIYLGLFTKRGKPPHVGRPRRVPRLPRRDHRRPPLLQAAQPGHRQPAALLGHRRLARANAMRNPRRTAATASALMIGVGLVVMFAIPGQLDQGSVDRPSATPSPATLIVDSGSFGQTGLDPVAGDRHRRTPRCRVAVGIRFGFRRVRRQHFISPAATRRRSRTPSSSTWSPGAPTA